VEAIGTILRALRESKGLTVQAAAEAIGVHRATIYAWEAGDKLPEPTPLARAVDLYEAPQEERDRIARLRAYGPLPEGSAC
jgi:transcriptional regulator with XRE-family HTH domain